MKDDKLHQLDKELRHVLDLHDQGRPRIVGILLTEEDLEMGTKHCALTVDQACHKIFKPKMWSIPVPDTTDDLFLRRHADRDRAYILAAGFLAHDQCLGPIMDDGVTIAEVYR